VIDVYNLVILDESGSMGRIRRGAVEGFNETLETIRKAQQDYKETQRHYVSLLLFCNCNRRYIYENVPVQEVRPLNLSQYNPCCGTPLYDAMGFSLNRLYALTKENPNSTAAVTVITDGMENSSLEFSGSMIKALVEKLTAEEGWNFSYIGANQDVEKVGESLAIRNTMSFQEDEAGTQLMWERERKSRSRIYSNMHFCLSLAEEDGDPRTVKSRMKDMHASKRNFREFGEFAHRITPAHVTSLREGQIFVFGSNADGIHDGGAALVALTRFGAVAGQAEGLQGQSYGIITTEDFGTLERSVIEFLRFARVHPELTFLVTAIGCGTAGHSPSEMARFFVPAMDMENVWLPEVFWREIV
jgi:hypothetical protein